MWKLFTLTLKKKKIMDTHEAFSCLLRMQLPYGNVTALSVLQCFGKTDHSSAERLTCDVMWELACSRCHLTEMVHLLHDFTNSAIGCGLHLNRFKWTCQVLFVMLLFNVFCTTWSDQRNDKKGTVLLVYIKLKSIWFQAPTAHGRPAIVLHVFARVTVQCGLTGNGFPGKRM